MASSEPSVETPTLPADDLPRATSPTPAEAPVSRVATPGETPRAGGSPAPKRTATPEVSQSPRATTPAGSTSASPARPSSSQPSEGLWGWSSWVTSTVSSVQNVVSSVSEDIYSTLDPEYEKERTKKLKAKARAAATTGKDTVEPAGLELPKGLTEGFNQGIAQLEKVSTEALAVAETALAAAENYTAQALNAAETVGTEAINAVESLGTTAFSFLNDTFQFTKANKEDEIVGEVGSNGGVPVQEGGKQEKISQSDVEVAPVRTDEQHVDDSK